MPPEHEGVRGRVVEQLRTLQLAGDGSTCEAVESGGVRLEDLSDKFPVEQVLRAIEVDASERSGVVGAVFPYPVVVAAVLKETASVGLDTAAIRVEPGRSDRHRGVVALLHDDGVVRGRDRARYAVRNGHRVHNRRRGEGEWIGVLGAVDTRRRRPIRRVVDNAARCSGDCDLLGFAVHGGRRRRDARRLNDVTRQVEGLRSLRNPEPGHRCSLVADVREPQGDGAAAISRNGEGAGQGCGPIGRGNGADRALSNRDATALRIDDCGADLTVARTPPLVDSESGSVRSGRESQRVVHIVVGVVLAVEAVDLFRAGIGNEAVLSGVAPGRRTGLRLIGCRIKQLASAEPFRTKVGARRAASGSGIHVVHRLCRKSLDAAGDVTRQSRHRAVDRVGLIRLGEGHAIEIPSDRRVRDGSRRGVDLDCAGKVRSLARYDRIGRGFRHAHWRCTRQDGVSRGEDITDGRTADGDRLHRVVPDRSELDRRCVPWARCRGGGSVQRVPDLGARVATAQCDVLRRVVPARGHAHDRDTCRGSEDRHFIESISPAGDTAPVFHLGRTGNGHFHVPERLCAGHLVDEIAGARVVGLVDDRGVVQSVQGARDRVLVGSFGSVVQERRGVDLVDPIGRAQVDHRVVRVGVSCTFVAGTEESGAGQVRSIGDHVLVVVGGGTIDGNTDWPVERNQTPRLNRNESSSRVVLDLAVVLHRSETSIETHWQKPRVVTRALGGSPVRTPAPSVEAVTVVSKGRNAGRLGAVGRSVPEFAQLAPWPGKGSSRSVGRLAR